MNIVRIFLVCLFLNSLPIEAATLLASVDRNQLSSSETLTLTLQLDESSNDEPDTHALEQQFKIISRNKTSNIRIINGDLSSATTWYFELAPRKSGSLQIPGIYIDGNASNAIDISVSEKPATQAAGQQHIYTETYLQQDKVFVQQQAIVTWRLVSRYNILEPQFSPPQIDNVLTQDLGSRSFQRTSSEGYIERVIEQSYALFPQTSGKVTIPSQQFQLVIDTPQRTNMGYFRPNRTQIRVATDEKNLEVMPAIDTSQHSVWLPATSLAFSQEILGLDKNNQATEGSAFTRIIKLRAEGLSAEQLPPIDMQMANAKTYNEKPVLKNSNSQQGVIGLREDRSAIIATQPGKLTLPEVVVRWYNVNNGTWQEAKLPVETIDVLPSNTTSTPESHSPDNHSPDSQPTQSSAGKGPTLSSDSTSLPQDPTIRKLTLFVIIFVALSTALALYVLLLKKRSRYLPNRRKPAREAYSFNAFKDALNNNDLPALHKALTLWKKQQHAHGQELPDIAMQTLDSLEGHLYGKCPVPDLQALRKLCGDLHQWPANTVANSKVQQHLEQLYR